jgi:RNA polymerase sigma factor (sigma-70 family)
MPASPAGSDPTERMPAAARAFATTHWSVVVAAGRTDSPSVQAALSQLCQTYWYPLYAFVRRQGHSPHDAQDLTQEYFARMLEKNCLADVERSKGRFRSFLLASLKHFLANEWDKARAQKRGGGVTFIPLDAASAETRYGIEPADTETADKLFERRWALTLLDRVLTRLRDEYATQGKLRVFDQLKHTLTGESASAPYAELSIALGTTEGAVKVVVHRLRKRYRELLRDEIADTVSNKADVEEELRHLFDALAG